MNRALGTALAALLLAAALGGCGGGEASTTVATSSAPATHSKSSAADETGRKACAGLTPLQAARRYELPARKAGATKAFASYIAHPPPSTLNSPGFPRLVAALYASTLPAPQRADAAAGCAEELASPSSARQDSP